MGTLENLFSNPQGEMIANSSKKEALIEAFIRKQRIIRAEIRKSKRNLFFIFTGSGAYDSIRPLAYQDANVFLLCFNVGDPDDLKLAINKVRIFFL